MKSLNWLTAFSNVNKPMQMLGLFRKRRNNNGGWMLVSVVALGGSALFYALRRGGNIPNLKPVQNFVNNVQNTFQTSNIRTELAEFANEITPLNNIKINNEKEGSRNRATDGTPEGNIEGPGTGPQTVH